MSDHVLVCPHCLALNNLSQSELLNLPLCFECDSELLPQKPIEANKKCFIQYITHSTLPIVVDFWGTWSGSGYDMADTFVSLADTFKNDALFLRINSEQEQVLANDYKLLDIPTFIIFTSGLEYHRLHGVISEYEFHIWLERYLRIKRKKATHRPSSV
ncbi:thioredoxin domain-containing protein [Psychromonas hadalis]|uniref:thioredoxin domain-containing protein n=1 Tax=Psychromonas hadalis TaxID=211669 RepID=UPI0003B5112A|nr:thioredoxin domain-containing protein [Psychromonas hadalis]